MKESVFSSIYADDKQKYLDLKFNDPKSKLIFEDDDVLIFDINSQDDYYLFAPDDQFSSWEDLTYNGVIKRYVFIDFEDSKRPKNAAVYPSGQILAKDFSDFGYKHKLKPRSKEELQKFNPKHLVNAISDDIVDIDFFDFNTQLELVTLKPKLIRKLNPDLLSDDEFVALVDANAEAPKHLSKKYLLRYKKAKLNPEELDTLDKQDLYAFLAKDKFIEMPNGMFKKDLEIENLQKIDQYSREGQTVMAMLHLRARIQDDVSLYLLWSNKGLIEDALNDQPWKINDDEHQYLRDAIRGRMIPASQAKSKSLL